MTPRTTAVRGFTLVELLVAVAIIATLFGLVVAGARPGADGQVRQATQTLSSAFMATQSRALGQPVGAAIILESGVNSTDIASITVANASMPPLISGTARPATGAGAFDLFPLTGDADELEHAYRIRFGGVGSAAAGAVLQPPSAWFSLACPASGTSASVRTGTIGFRNANGQTSANSIVPEPPATGPLQFTATSYPTKGESVMTFPKGAAIDLRYSGIGEEPTEIWDEAKTAATGSSVPGWGNLAGKGSIAFVYDSVGRIEAVMQRVTEAASTRAIQPTRPGEPIYLLVTSRDWITDNPTQPLGNPKAFWVVLHPQTGRTSAAFNVPQTGIDAAALRAARAKARAGTLGGK
jgi:prepilin-type N-terminal cleavage/methylation domain-containing protein